MQEKIKKAPGQNSRYLPAPLGVEEGCVVIRPSKTLTEGNMFKVGLKSRKRPGITSWAKFPANTGNHAKALEYALAFCCEWQDTVYGDKWNLAEVHALGRVAWAKMMRLYRDLLA